MKRILLIISIFSFTALTAQKQGSTRLDPDALKRQIDSSTKMMDSLTNASIKKMRQEEMNRTLNSGNDYFLELQRENERKQRQQMYIRLAMGAVLAAVFAVGIARRRKKAKENKVS